MADAPSLDAIRAARVRLGDLVETTPVRRLVSPQVQRRLGKTEVFLKEELFQRTGSFKPRGALCVMLDLSPAELARGVTAVSRIPSLLGVGLIWVWRLTFGALFPTTCKYHPSCSEYAVQSLRRHGLVRGSVLAGWRLLRCNPWSRGGFDPVR